MSTGDLGQDNPGEGADLVAVADVVAPLCAGVDGVVARGVEFVNSSGGAH